MPKLSLPELEKLIDSAYPAWRAYATLESIGERDLVVRMPFRKDLLRAGGTISGPALMALADTSAYYLLLAHAGDVLGAATANLDIHFLARPSANDIVAKATMLRLGRRLAVTAIDLHDHEGALVAHATVTYALPPARA